MLHPFNFQHPHLFSFSCGHAACRSCWLSHARRNAMNRTAFIHCIVSLAVTSILIESSEFQLHVHIYDNRKSCSVLRCNNWYPLLLFDFSVRIRSNENYQQWRIQTFFIRSGGSSSVRRRAPFTVSPANEFSLYVSRLNYIILL